MNFLLIGVLSVAQTIFFLTSMARSSDLDGGSGPTDAQTLECKRILALPKVESFLPLYKDVVGGKLYVEIPKDHGLDLLYQSTLTSGFGSRDIDGDRGQFGNARVDSRFGTGRLLSFVRFGQKLLLVERNTTYYTPLSSFDDYNDPGLSFSDSILGEFDSACEAEGGLLVNITDLFLLDGMNIPHILSKQGKYSSVAKGTVVDVAHAHKSTVQSIEVDSVFVFSTDDSPDNSIIARLAADRSKVLVHERTSLIPLPDKEKSHFRPRQFDIRSGFFDQTYYDLTRLDNQSGRQSFIVRQLLNAKGEDQGQISDKVAREPESPIIYYIDPAIPADLHSLIKEALSWWNSAFEEAGFKDAIRAEDLNSGIDPFDAGVNVILWVPRETRGFSWSGVTTDPRTGQILKAVVRLDAMRLQADKRLLDALTDPYVERPNFAAREEALKQRFRLLVAHEIGHTLGLRHQYIASAQTMSSVMEYPFPNLSLDASGSPVLHEVFPQGVGAWDKAAIYYGYHPFSEADEAAGLRSAVEGTEAQGAYWITDKDTGDAHPLAQKWDRGTDPVAELERVLALREAALSRFSRSVIPGDQPLSALRDALVPLYLLHQFEVKAVASMLGGYIYRYALRDGPEPTPVPPARQRQALRALLGTLSVDTLLPRQQVLDLMSPRPPTYPSSPESFSGDTGNIFDAFRPIEDATSITMNEVLKPERAVRLAQANARDPSAPDLDEVLGAIVAQTWKSAPRDGAEGAAQRTIALGVLRSILASATTKAAPLAVRGACWAALDDIHTWVELHPSSLWKDTDAYAVHAIVAAERRPEAFDPPQQRTPVLDPMGELE
jgi:Met-zincin/Domain of unknown function (DUF5117)